MLIATPVEIKRLVGNSIDLSCFMKFKHNKKIYYSLSIVIEIIFRLSVYIDDIPYEKSYKAI